MNVTNFFLHARNHLILVSGEPQYNAARECLEDWRAFRRIGARGPLQGLRFEENERRMMPPQNFRQSRVRPCGG
ncbi:MAG: hypothetical protein DMG30_21590 [Acidobacteria bacterium]|nr:MAG: hypothetical protein DMG30_21590 [Acidobacteriota bacterium]